jgi:hypothetical protein
MKIPKDHPTFEGLILLFSKTCDVMIPSPFAYSRLQK